MHTLIFVATNNAITVSTNIARVAMAQYEIAQMRANTLFATNDDSATETRNGLFLQLQHSFKYSITHALQAIEYIATHNYGENTVIDEKVKRDLLALDDLGVYAIITFNVYSSDNDLTIGISIFNEYGNKLAQLWDSN